MNKFYNTDGTLCRYYIVNYCVTSLNKKPNMSIDIKYKASPHRNSKAKDPYIRTKPSVLKAIKHHGKNMKPKHVVNVVEKAAGGVYGSNSQSEVVRNRRQV